MPRAGFKPEIPMFERPKTVLALDRSAIETGDSVTELLLLLLVVVVLVLVLVLVS
jgi:hypothetical protein